MKSHMFAISILFVFWTFFSSNPISVEAKGKILIFFLYGDKNLAVDSEYLFQSSALSCHETVDLGFAILNKLSGFIVKLEEDTRIHKSCISRTVSIPSAHVYMREWPCCTLLFLYC